VAEQKTQPLKATAASKQMAQMYRQCFATKAGALVLADLTRQFYDAKMDSGDINRDVGKRDVVRHIKQRIENA